MWLVVFFYIFMAVSLVNLVHLGLYLVGANFYDVVGFRREQRRTQRTRRAPRVTVLIPAHNEERAIVRCIESVRRSTVRDLEIVVIDDASTDTTARVVTDYIRMHPNFNSKVSLVRLLTNVGKAEALNHALRSYVDTEFVMTLDADSTIDQHAIERATDYLIDDPAVAGVAANVRVLETPTVLGLLQRFEYLVGYRSKKFYSVSNSEFIVGGVGSTYRYSVLKEVGFYDTTIQTEDIALSLKIAALGNRAHKLVYAVDVLAMTESVQTISDLMRQRYRWKLGSLQSLFKYRALLLNTDSKYSRSLTWYRMPMAIIGEIIVLTEPLLLGVIVYFSFMSLSFETFVGAYLFITAYLLWSVWPDEHMRFVEKLKMTSYAPVMYFLFYIMNVVQLSAVLRCIMNLQLISGQRTSDSVWVSPKRAEFAVSASK